VRRFFNFIGISLSFLLVLIFSAWLTMRWVTSGKTVTVPDLRGKDVVEALKEVGRIGLDLRVVGEEYNETVPRNRILEQSPSSGTGLKVDQNIGVVLSLGMREVAVPDVRGMALGKAEVILKQNGLSVSRLTWAHSEMQERDTVLSQNPIPPASNFRESVVDLLVGLGPRPTEYRMPDLIGDDFNQAVGLLESGGLVIGNVRYEEYKGVPENRIINQAPAFGAPVDEGRPVALVVSREPRMQSATPITRIPFRYRIPIGLLPVATDVFVEDRRGRREVYAGRKFPGTLLELTIEVQGDAVVEVYLNGKKVQSREYH
jgi:beta-lactam-binding protein with PASTA domain